MVLGFDQFVELPAQLGLDGAAKRAQIEVAGTAVAGLAGRLLLVGTDGKRAVHFE